MSSFIEVTNLKKTFKVSKRSKGIPGMLANMVVPKFEEKQAVKNISFSIEKGEMVGFIGPNGAGKSTTIKMLSGILCPDGGEIQVAGYVPYKQRKTYVQNIGVVFGQKSQLQWDLPVIDSFELLKAIYRIPEEQYKKNFNRFVEMLDMSEFLNRPVRQLSLGQRMRADIVAALLHSPQVIFFDEPTIGVDVVGKETIQREDGVERRLRLLGHILPCLDEGLILGLGSQLQGVHHGVVPQSLYLDLVTVTRRYGLAVDHRVHPRNGEVAHLGPDQTVLVQHDAAVHALAVVLQDALHGLAIVLPDILGTDMLLQALQRPEEPQRSIHCYAGRSRTDEHAILHLANERVEGCDAVLLVVLLEGNTGQRNEGLTTLLTVPGVTLDNLHAAVRTAHDKLTGSVLEAADEINLVGTTSDRLLEHLLDLLTRLHLVERSGEDDALALLQLTLEITGREQILVAVVATSQVLQVLEVVVPIGSGHKLGIGLRGLHIEPGERLVHTALHAIDGGIRVAVSLHIGLRQGVLVTEGEEGTQAEFGLRVCIHERVANHQLRALVNPQHLLLQNHTTHTVGNGRGGRVLEVGDVLVATRLIHTTIAVQGQIKRLVVLNDGLIER